MRLSADNSPLTGQVVSGHTHWSWRKFAEAGEENILHASGLSCSNAAAQVRLLPVLCAVFPIGAGRSSAPKTGVKKNEVRLTTKQVPHDRLQEQGCPEYKRCEVAANNKRSTEERSSDLPQSTKLEVRERPSVSSVSVEVKSSWQWMSKSRRRRAKDVKQVEASHS